MQLFRNFPFDKTIFPLQIFASLRVQSRGEKFSNLHNKIPLMKKFVITATMAFVAFASTQADVGVVETTGQFSVLASNSPSTTTNYLSGIGGGGNPRWTNYNFGVFDPSSNSLTFQNFYFENYAYNGGSIPPGGSFNDNWLDGSSTATLTIYRNGTNFYQVALAQTATNGNNRNWSISGGANVNLLSGATNGFNTVGFIVDWTYNQWSGSQTIVGNTSTSLGGSDAFFQVVPEPSTYALLALSAAALGGYVIRGRRRRS